MSRKDYVLYAFLYLIRHPEFWDEIESNYHKTWSNNDVLALDALLALAED